MVQTSAGDRCPRDFKTSAQKYLNRADALVTAGSLNGLHPWPGVDPRLIADRPCFSVSTPEYSNHELNHFVRQKVGLAEGVQAGSGPAAGLH